MYSLLNCLFPTHKYTSSPWIHPSHLLSYIYQVFDLRHCYEEMQRQAREACVAVAAQTAAVRGISYIYSTVHTCTYMYTCTCHYMIIHAKRSNSLHNDFDGILNSHYSTIYFVQECYLICGKASLHSPPPNCVFFL